MNFQGRAGISKPGLPSPNPTLTTNNTRLLVSQTFDYNPCIIITISYLFKENRVQLGSIAPPPSISPTNSQDLLTRRLLCNSSFWQSYWHSQLRTGQALKRKLLQAIQEMLLLLCCIWILTEDYCKGHNSAATQRSLSVMVNLTLTKNAK